MRYVKLVASSRRIFSFDDSGNDWLSVSKDNKDKLNCNPQFRLLNELANFQLIDSMQIGPMESVHYSISKLIISKLLCRLTFKIKFPYATKCNDNPLADCLYVCNFSEINPFRRSFVSNF